MAERIIKQLIDDLDGKSIDNGFGERIEFSYQGTDYLIDLRPANAEKLDAALKPYIEVAEKIGSARRGRKGHATEKSSGSGRSKEQMQAIREWATRSGHEVALRGRIKQEIFDAFDAAH